MSNDAGENSAKREYTLLMETQELRVFALSAVLNCVVRHCSQGRGGHYLDPIPTVIKVRRICPGNLSRMTDQDGSPTPRPARPTSARGEAPRSEGPKPARRGRDGGQGRKGEGRPKDRRPTPARTLQRSSDRSGPAAEPDIEAVTLCALDPPWTVRVLGRGGGDQGGAVPLMLLGFWEPDSVESAPKLEAWAVGTRFSEISCDVIETLVARAKPHRERSSRPQPETRPRRRGGRRGGRGAGPGRPR